MLLGYFEQGPVYNSINFSLCSHGNSSAYTFQPQVTAITTRIASMLCPSSPLPVGTNYGNFPIPGNCYFWSAPSQPFVLPARVRDFESVCRPSKRPDTAVPKARLDLQALQNLTAKTVQRALESSRRVWLYRVNLLYSKTEAGLLAVSRDYLQEEVAAGILADADFKLISNGSNWLKERLPTEIETVLSRHRVRPGYAVLAGVARPVWVIPLNEIKLAKGKTIRPQPVEVSERI